MNGHHLKELLHWSRLRRALAFVGPHRRAVAVILAFTILTAAISAMMPLAMKYIFDRLGSKALAPVLLGVGALAGLSFLREAASGLSNWLSWRTRLKIHAELLEATVTRLHRIPLGLHREEGVGAIMTRLDRSIQGFIGAVSEISFNVLPAFFYLLIA
nr:ABC transporter transmembrane domain-containing protein [Desulfobacteraceae bacterium]